MAALEGANHGLAFASGMSAINNVLNLLQAGDHVVACSDLYGGAYRLFTKLYSKFGITFSFVDATDAAAESRLQTHRRLGMFRSAGDCSRRLSQLNMVRSG